jgi:thiosulfate/3-mercaptopyruvate sulfurtransferase
MSTAVLMQAQAMVAAAGRVIIDCRFSLGDPDEGRRLYQDGHIPGAYYLDLNQDLSGPVEKRGGRHPLPDPGLFVSTLAALGVGPETEVIAYDDSGLAYAARLWWMMRSIGFRPPALLDGGYQTWLALGLAAQKSAPAMTPCTPVSGASFSGVCDIDGLRQAQGRGATVVDSRESRRYEGLEEPIDPIAGHIPGAINRPWQGVTADASKAGNTAAQREHWGDALAASELVVYCGSGVTACVNLFSLAVLGREDAALYAGSWSDWCSYLEHS